MEQFFADLVQYNDWGLFALRLTVGLIFLYHAFPKLARSKAMAKMLGAPVAMPIMMGIVEALGAAGLILGYQVQLSALVLGVIMIGAIGMKMMKWGVPFAAMDKTGWEFDLILLAANAALLLGAGGSIGA